MKRHSKNVVSKNALKKMNKQKPNEILRNFEVINKIFCQIKEKNFISLHLYFFGPGRHKFEKNRPKISL